MGDACDETVDPAPFSVALGNSVEGVFPAAMDLRRRLIERFARPHGRRGSSRAVGQPLGLSLFIRVAVDSGSRSGKLHN